MSEAITGPELCRSRWLQTVLVVALLLRKADRLQHNQSVEALGLIQLHPRSVAGEDFLGNWQETNVMCDDYRQQADLHPPGRREVVVLRWEQVQPPKAFLVMKNESIIDCGMANAHGQQNHDRACFVIIPMMESFQHLNLVLAQPTHGRKALPYSVYETFGRGCPQAIYPAGLKRIVVSLKR